MKKNAKLKKKIAAGNMSGSKDSGSPFGKGVKSKFAMNKLIPTKKKKKK
jgi:hypothetical protein